MIRVLVVFVAAAFLLCACASSAPEPDVESDQVVATANPTAGQTSATVPTDDDVMYRVFAAELLGSEGDLSGAVGEYLEAAMQSNDPAIAMRATRVAFAAQAWQQAAMAADRWALLDPDNLAAHEAAVLSMLSTSDYAGAELHLLEILRLAEDKESAWLQIARLLGRSASPEKAMKTLTNLLAEQGDESSAIGFYIRSQLALRTGDAEQATDLARQAAETLPERSEFLAWAGRLALNQGDLSAGTDFIRRAWELDPDDHDMTLAYADLLARVGEADKARGLMREMKQTPDVMLSRILFELGAGDIPAALALYTAFDTMTFDDPRVKAFYQARAAESLDELEQAIGFYSSIRDGTLMVPATARKAELLAMKGDMPAARNTLAELRMHSDPAVVEESWLAEARILQQAGNAEAAMDTLNRAVEQFTDSIALRYSRALLAAEAGNIDVAEADLRRVLIEQPDNPAALNALGYTLADQTDRLEEAEELIRRAYTLQPDDASITDSMGWVLFRLGRLEEAERYLRHAWAMDQNPEIAAHLGEVLWRQGRREEARSLWQEAGSAAQGSAILDATVRRLESDP